MMSLMTYSNPTGPRSHYHTFRGRVRDVRKGQLIWPPLPPESEEFSLIMKSFISSPHLSFSPLYIAYLSLPSSFFSSFLSTLYAGFLFRLNGISCHPKWICLLSIIISMSWYLLLYQFVLQINYNNFLRVFMCQRLLK